MTPRLALLLLAAAAGALSACASPTIRPPEVPVTTRGPFVGAGPQTSLAEPPADWWRLFDDPGLDRQVQRALAANADLRVAFANLEAARVATAVAEGARWPATVIESGAGPDRADRQPSTSSVPKTSYELGATFAFEIDLFGRLKAAALAARADADAVAAARDGVRLAVVADATAAWIDLCAAGERLRLARDLYAAQARSLALVSEQLRAGEVSPLEQAQAGVLRDQAAAALPQIEADAQRARLRLATLQGRPPADADARCDVMPRLKAPLPVGDGAGLIARRPDLREAERRLAAADARAFAARADLYPKIQLGGSGGLIGGGSDAILTPLITWSFPNQAAPRARLNTARATATAARAGWDKAMLTALEEVEAALSDYQAEHRRREALRAAEAGSERALTRAKARHRLGADSYLAVVDAERSRNGAATQRLASDARLSQLQVAIFRALGGGWRADDGVKGQTPAPAAS